MSDAKHKCDVEAIVRASWESTPIYDLAASALSEPQALRCPECGATISFTFDGTLTSRDNHTGRVTRMRVKIGGRK